MTVKNFFDSQDDLTAAKIAFYEDYIGVYLFKLLSGFKKCFIADLFCGPGKNGDKDGSPLALIKKIEYVFGAPGLKDAKVYILFNDVSPKHIKKLKTELGKIKIKKTIKIFKLCNQKFEDILKGIIKTHNNTIIPKFFFLDPFSYSNVKISHLQELMALKNTEVLLFLPSFFAYRFKDANFKDEHETRKFFNEFTTKGMPTDTISEFIDSIKNKLKKELNLNFVRPVLLDFGSRKNSLFLLTKNEKGMLLMNNLCIKKSEDGSGIKIKKYGRETPPLFEKNEILPMTARYKVFKKNFIKQLQQQKQMTNEEVVYFAIVSEFRPQDAKNILKELKELGKIEVFDKEGNRVNQLNKFYVAEKLSGHSVFKYVP